MITISIGSSERSLEDATPDWINQQINRRRDDSQDVCVRVRVKCHPIDVVLTSPDCPGGGGGGRPPRPEEKEVFALWEKRGMKDDDFTGGNLVAFLRQLESLVGSC